MKYLTVGINSLEKDKFNNVTNIGRNKPIGGLWCSPYTPNESSDSPWIEFCRTEEFCSEDELNRGIIINLKDNINLLIIDKLNDLEKILEEYSINVCRYTSYLDFEKLSDKYDGVYLSDNGQWETRLSLYGWDVESLLLFNLDCVESWERYYGRNDK